MPLFPWQEPRRDVFMRQGRKSHIFNKSSIINFEILYPFSYFGTWGVPPMDPSWKSTRNCLWLRQIYLDIYRSSCRFKPFHLKIIYSKSEYCQRIWFIWTWEPNECFTPVWLTEGLATSHRRVLCEATGCKSQLNMKSHLHIQLKETASCIPKFKNLLLQMIPKPSDLSTVHRIKDWIKISTLNSKWLLQEFWLTHSFFLFFFLFRLQGGCG